MGVLRYARVAGYDYDVFEDGAVWSVKGFKFMKPQRQRKKNGNKYYLYVRLSKDGKVKKHYIHRLVAEAFVPNPDNKPTVNHKDGNTENNVHTNLEWSTMQEQVDHAWQAGLTDSAGEKCVTSKLTAAQVIEIRALHSAGESQAQLARTFGIGTSQVNRIIKGQSWHKERK
jgi:hypothetical protein